jgi:hypothetical protein
VKDTIKLGIAGLVGIGLVTAFGLHARQLSALPRPTGRAVSGVFSTAETGKAA